MRAAIRRKLLSDGLIDTVIGLPANLFYSTGIPVCILVLKKCKKSDDMLFINAAEHFVKGKRQNQLAELHIDDIVKTYQHRKEQDPSDVQLADWCPSCLLLELVQQGHLTPVNAEEDPRYASSGHPTFPCPVQSIAHVLWTPLTSPGSTLQPLSPAPD